MGKTKKDFDDKVFADSYILKHRGMLKNLGKMYAEKITTFGITSGKILDVGCGCGTLDNTIAMLLPEFEITGIDLSDYLLDYARKEVETKNLKSKITFLKGDVYKIPVEENEFDIILNINMVHWVNEPIKMLDEIERVTKPGGIIFIKDLKKSFMSIVEKEIKNAYSISEIRKIFAQSNIRDGKFIQSLIWWDYFSN